MNLTGRFREWFGKPSDTGLDVPTLSAIRAGLVLIGGFLVTFLIWATWAPLSGAVIAQGQIKIDMNRKTVQHLEGGIVREVLVRDGQIVRQGQILIRLDGVQVDAEHDRLRREHEAEQMRNARLVAEQVFAGEISVPSSLEQRSNLPEVAVIIRREQQVFAARLKALNEETRLLKTQVGLVRNEESALLEQNRADEETLRLQKDELGLNEKLVERNFIQRTRIIALQRGVTEYESRRGQTQAELAKARQKAGELELRSIGLRNAYVQRATDELRESSARLSELQNRLRPYADALKRLSVTAPVAGEVVGLRVFSTGAVLAPREPVLDIVPHERRLIVEARLNVQDVAHVHAGSRADVRLVALNKQMTPIVSGRVTYVSADRISERPEFPPYYMVQAAIDPGEMEKIGNPELRAGMPVEMYVQTKARTVLQYLLDPLSAHLARSWREP